MWSKKNHFYSRKSSHKTPNYGHFIKVPLRRQFVGLFRTNSVVEYRVVSIFTQKTEQETINPLSPPQRLLLVNTSERNGSGSAGERKRERGERWEEGKGGSLCQIMFQNGARFPREAGASHIFHKY